MPQVPLRAIHYYFADIDDLIDQAMAAHIAAFIERLRQAAPTVANPARRF